MRIDDIISEVRSCKKCALWKNRNNSVVGEGDPNAKIMFIGEAPGYNEDIQGKPFVGAAGKILDEMLPSMGLGREDVYITNIIKCRPPNNRNPLMEEIKKCSLYLDRQIEMIKPTLICPLGNFAASYILKKYSFKPLTISKIHGKIFEVKTLTGEIKIIPLFHPAALIYNQRLKKKMEDDLVIVKKNI
jgi:DNA polymerase